MKTPGKKYGSFIALIALLALLVGVPGYMSSYTVILITNILMYVVLTLSWAIFSGPTGYISLASAAFFGTGVYASALLSSSLPLPVVIVIGGSASFTLAFLVGSLPLGLKGLDFPLFPLG